MKNMNLSFIDKSLPEADLLLYKCGKSTIATISQNYIN